MSVLSDRDISEAIGGGQLKVDPYFPEKLGPASLDVHLSPLFRTFWFGYEDNYIDPMIDQAHCTMLEDVGEHGIFILPAGGFALASTMEAVSIPDTMVARIEGKSSLARLGLQVHITAGFLDPGFTGQVTLEIANVNSRPMRLHAGMMIAQLSFENLHSRCAREPYGSKGGSKYQDSEGPVASRYWKNYQGMHTETS